MTRARALSVSKSLKYLEALKATLVIGEVDEEKCVIARIECRHERVLWVTAASLVTRLRTTQYAALPAATRKK